MAGSTVANHVWDLSAGPKMTEETGNMTTSANSEAFKTCRSMVRLSPYVTDMVRKPPSRCFTSVLVSLLAAWALELTGWRAQLPIRCCWEVERSCLGPDSAGWPRLHINTVLPEAINQSFRSFPSLNTFEHCSSTGLKPIHKYLQC